MVEMPLTFETPARKDKKAWEAARPKGLKGPREWWTKKPDGNKTRMLKGSYWRMKQMEKERP